MEKGAFNTTFMSGEEFHNWLEKAEAAQAADGKAGFLAKMSRPGGPRRSARPGLLAP